MADQDLAVGAAPAPAAMPDRGWSIASRILALTLTAMLLAVAVAATSVWAVSRSNDFGREIAALSRARQAATLANTRFEVLGRATGPEVATASERYHDAAIGAFEAIDGLDDVVAGDVVSEMIRESEEFSRLRVENPNEPGQARLFASAIDAQGRLDQELDRAERRLVSDLDDFRRRVTIGLVGLVAVGSLLLIVVGRLIGRSIAEPLRLLGRRLRRFGDGDLGIRAPAGPGDIGLIGRSFNSMADSVTTRVELLNRKAERDSHLRMVSDGLDLASTEADVCRISAQAFGALAPDAPAEMLIHAPGSVSLDRAAINPVAGAAGCPVEVRGDCVAIRRAQTVTFANPDDMDACPQLALHERRCSAACIPVGSNGEVVGVVHVTGPVGEIPSAEVIDQLSIMSTSVGLRVGVIRTLESTRLEASTDGLTGLANRRLLEARLGELFRTQVPFSLAVADLDRFKYLNDNYGHEVGDRALQVFAKVLDDNVRGHDLVARYGGEEFVLVYPELTVQKATEVIERIRVALGPAIDAEGLPAFTCSFGVAHSSMATSAEEIVRIADAGLLTAKDQGRDRVVFSDEQLAAEVFGRPAVDTDAAGEVDIAGEIDGAGENEGDADDGGGAEPIPVDF